MDKQDIIEIMHGKGFAEQVEEIYDHDHVMYRVFWKRVSDGFQGPTIEAVSAQDAFIESAFKTLGAANGNHSK